MYKVVKNKRGLELVTPFTLQVTKQVLKIPLLVTYYLTKFDDIIKRDF